MSQDDLPSGQAPDLLLNQMDLLPWPGPAEYVLPDFAAFFEAIKTPYAEMFRKLSSALLPLTQADFTLHPGTHDSGRAIDINVTGVSSMPEPIDLATTRQWIADSLVNDYDCDRDMADKAAMKVDTEHLEEYTDEDGELDEDGLVDFVHDNKSFWED